MENTRLIALIATLSNKEIKGMHQFLNSPFFNNRASVTRLFLYLTDNMTLHKLIPTREDSYYYVISSKNKTEPYDDQQIRLWMSYLLKLIEKFLVHHSFFEDEINVKTKLAEIYRQRNLPKHQERNLSELQKLINKSTFRNAAFYSNDFRLQLEQYRFQSSNKRMSELNLQKMTDSLDVSYISQKLRQSCFAMAHQTVYKTEYNLGPLKEIITYIDNTDLLEIPAISVFYYAYKIMVEPDVTSNFHQLKKLLVESENKFTKEEFGDLFILAINFCIKRYNAGDRAYLKDEFEIYKHGIEQNLFLTNNMLSRFTYRNVVTVALVLEEYEWAEKFIGDYKNKIDKAYRESMYSFSMARLEYSRKNYSSALVLLQKAIYKDLLLNLAAKTVMLKIYFELEEFDLLDAHLGAMQTFIKRKNIIGYHKDNYLNLVYFTKKLMEVNPYDKSEKEQLRDTIASKKAIAEKEWLLVQSA